jgi:hypothetical protein
MFRLSANFGLCSREFGSFQSARRSADRILAFGVEFVIWHIPRGGPPAHPFRTHPVEAAGRPALSAPESADRVR